MIGKLNLSRQMFSVCCCVICSLGSPDFLLGQSLQQTYELAEEMANQQLFEEAIYPYQRVLFFDKNQRYAMEVHQALASCFLHLSRPKEAIQQLGLAHQLSKVPEQKVAFRFQQVGIHLLEGEFDKAQNLLLGMSPQTHTSRRFHFYAGISWYGLQEADSAWQHFHQFVGEGQAAIHLQLDGLYASHQKMVKKNPRRARILSSVLPGLGQLYGGDIKNGLNSFLLTNGLIVLAVHLAIVVSPLDGILTILPWFLRYYQGGVRRAGELLTTKQFQRRSRLYQEILTAMEEARRGE